MDNKTLKLLEIAEFVLHKKQRIQAIELDMHMLYFLEPNNSDPEQYANKIYANIDKLTEQEIYYLLGLAMCLTHFAAKNHNQIESSVN